MPDSKASKRDERKERLAAELRANLKKRKALSRTRQKQAEDAGPEVTGRDEPAPPDLRPPDPSAKP